VLRGERRCAFARCCLRGREMYRTRGLVAAMGALLAMDAGAQVLDPEMTMRPMVLPSPERPATVLELLAIPESGERLVLSEDQGPLTLLTLPETAYDVAGQRSAEGLARANENRVTAAERREQALQRASERRGNVVRDAVEARERSTDFNA